MVINIKHFMITIIAIFLSLGIGIFIGVIIDSQHLFIEQQKVLVSQIEEEFDGFRQKNYELMNKIEDYKMMNDRNNKLLDVIYKKLTEKDLMDLNVMVIDLFSDSDYLDITKDLNNSGIEEIIEVKLPKKSNESIGDMVKILKSRLEIESKNKDEIEKGNREKLLSKLIINEYNTLPLYLKKIGFLDYKGSIYSVIDYVILVDNGFKINNRNYKAVRREIISLIKDNNIPVMIVEKADTSLSSIPFYKKLGISTVDNADTKLGKIAMLMILKGKKGNFGEKETAECLLPEDFLVFD